MSKKHLTYYSKKEENLNIITHGIGVILSIVGLVLLILKGLENGTALHLVSFVVFGLSLMVLYTASTLYHSVQSPTLRGKLNIFDHSAIYILIAGTYTPVALVTLNGWIGWTIFSVVWSIAFVGVFLKFFYTGRFKKISTASYVAMGWVVVFAMKPLINNLPTFGLYWLVGGGLFYTIGAVLYSIPKLKYNHAIFHVFVLLGSFSHFIMVYLYVN